MTEEQFNEAVAGTTEFRDITSVRQIKGGFYISATRRFVEDGGAGHVRLALASECVGASAEDTIDKVANFLRTGEF